MRLKQTVVLSNGSIGSYGKSGDTGLLVGFWHGVDQNGL